MPVSRGGALRAAASDGRRLRGGAVGQGGQKSRAFEALLSAVSLKNRKELEKDARLIEERHAAGELSEARHKDLRAIIEKARAGDWSAAEARAYEFRAPFGDRGSYFK